MKPKPPDPIVDAISLDPDPTDKLLTWLTLETPAGVARVALTRDAVEQLWGMLDQTMAALDVRLPALHRRAPGRRPKLPALCTEQATICADYKPMTPPVNPDPGLSIVRRQHL